MMAQLGWWMILVMIAGWGMLGVAASNKPHLVMLLASEWGFNNVGYHGNTEVMTPNIDALAKGGIILDRFYTFPSSLPPRNSILSGRVAAHSVIYNLTDPIAPQATLYNPKDPISGYAGLSLGMTTVAEKLKGLGYGTIYTGEWESGFATPLHLPRARGFDNFLGFFGDVTDYYSQKVAGDSLKDAYQKLSFFDTDAPPAKIESSFNIPLMAGDTVEDPAVESERDVCMHSVNNLWLNDGPAFVYSNTGFLEDSFTTFTMTQLWQHNPSIPLFLFHSFLLPHVPYQIPIAWQQPFVNVTNPNRRKYNAMLLYMDNVVGEIVNVLKVKKMYDNTLIIMTSDYGGCIQFRCAGNNYPLRGGRSNFFEGGVRVNAFAAGGVIPQNMVGKTITKYIHTADLYSTFLDFAGASPSYMIDEKAKSYSLPPVEGFSMKPLLTGMNTTSPRTEIFLSNQALIVNNYKIITGTQQQGVLQSEIWPSETSLQPIPIVGINANATYNSSYGMVNCGSGCLYDIFADPSESNDLSKTFPNIKQQLLARLAVLNTTLFLPSRGLPSPLSCLAGVTEWGGFFGPFAPSPNITF